jgi:hypothetical protein
MRMARSRAGTWSSISLTVSPIRCRAPPQQGHALCSTSRRRSSRGRCAGRLGPFVLHLRRPGLAQWKPSFGPREISVEVLKGELQLIATKLLGPSAKLVALKLLDDEVEPFDLGLRLAETGALGHE